MNRTEREELILASVRICWQRHHHDRYPKSFDPVIFVFGIRNAVSHMHIPLTPVGKLSLRFPSWRRELSPSFSSFCISDWSCFVSSFSIFVIVLLAFSSSHTHRIYFYYLSMLYGVFCRWHRRKGTSDASLAGCFWGYMSRIYIRFACIGRRWVNRLYNRCKDCTAFCLFRYLFTKSIMALIYSHLPFLSWRNHIYRRWILYNPLLISVLYVRLILV